MVKEAAVKETIAVLIIIIVFALAFLLRKLVRKTKMTGRTRILVIIFLAVAAVYIIIHGRDDSSLLSDLTPDSDQRTDYWPRDTMIIKQMDDLGTLQEKKWKGLSEDQRIATLQRVADIESRHLGIDSSVKIRLKADELDNTTIGLFNANEMTVSLNSIYLDQGGPYLMIAATCHELYHGYEFYLVNELADHRISRKQHTYEKARQYLNEFQNYKDSSSGFAGYYGQSCEADARSYADEAVVSYRNQINAHYGRNAINDKQSAYLIKTPGSGKMFYVTPDYNNVDGSGQ